MAEELTDEQIAELSSIFKDDNNRKEGLMTSTELASILEQTRPKTASEREVQNLTSNETEDGWIDCSTDFLTATAQTTELGENAPVTDLSASVSSLQLDEMEAAGTTRPPERNPWDVYVDIWEVADGQRNALKRWIGLGKMLYCVHVHGLRHTYISVTGITETSHLDCERFKKMRPIHSICMGRTQSDAAAVAMLIELLKIDEENQGGRYNARCNNSLHFSQRLCKRLLPDQQFQFPALFDPLTMACDLMRETMSQGWIAGCAGFQLAMNIFSLLLIVVLKQPEMALTAMEAILPKMARNLVMLGLVPLLARSIFAFRRPGVWLSVNFLLRAIVSTLILMAVGKTALGDWSLGLKWFISMLVVKLKENMFECPTSKI